MRQEDIERLCEHLDLSADAFGRRYLRRTVYKGEQVVALTEKRSNNDCVFWEDGAGCAVYQARPLQCRQWPFWPEVLATRASWDAEAEGCPGMNQGRRYSQAEIERIAGGKRGTLRGRRPMPLVSDED
jgi:Fe-S-cluster containining protein